MTSQEVDDLIDDVEHSLAVEHMPMTEAEKENLRKVGRGEMTYRDLVNQYVSAARELATSHG